VSVDSQPHSVSVDTLRASHVPYVRPSSVTGKGKRRFLILMTDTWRVKRCIIIIIIIKGKGSPYSIAERKVPELIPVLGSQPVGDVSHKPSSRLPLLSAGPAVTPATLNRAATNFAAW